MPKRPSMNGRKRPKKCQGEAWHLHAKGCHPRAPRCRWRRKKHEAWQICQCDAYHHGHRKGSGRCVHAKGNEEKRWRIMYGDDAVNAWLVESGQIARNVGSGHELAL